jgi:NAD(P)-dependent dehydrogenase (short-subunit alcohol dehydrogenase family)
MHSIFRDRILEGKVAFVTGGGSGIGQRIAERFSEHGARVTIAGRNAQKLETAALSMRASGGEVSTSAFDVRDYSLTETALAETRQRFGTIDILICAAAGNFPAPVTGMSANGFKSVIDIDLLGTFNTCRAAHAFLTRPGASIIAVSANHAHTPIAGQAHVCAAKAGVELLIRTLAIEWGSEGVRANCITPGPTDDTEGMRRLAPDENVRRVIERTIPLGRFGTKDELADLALFLSSGAADYVTGSVYACDGGQALTHPGSLLPEKPLPERAARSGPLERM